MKRRTTIELDDELLDRGKAALGCSTTRATVEDALRRAAATAEAETGRLVDAQRASFARFQDHGDLAVLASNEMWR